MFSLADYRFSLPKDLIAEEATHPAHDARLMIVDRSTGHNLADTTFWELGEYLSEDCVLFFNNSQVLPARITLQDVIRIDPSWEKTILNEGEILYLRHKDTNSFEALVRPGKKFKKGTRFILGKYTIQVEDITPDGRILSIEWGSIETCMQEHGALPLPPYIEYKKEKEADYQTVFAEIPGSVAAPTASLHFTEALLQKLPHERYMLTLHVGLGTFQPMNTADIRDYHIHEEIAEVQKSLFDTIAILKASHKKIVAVGTTACRTLESLVSLWSVFADPEKQSFPQETQDFWNTTTIEKKQSHWITHWGRQGDRYFFGTQAFIFPGYSFWVVDELITNFHLPESSLLVLVAALIGPWPLLWLYEEAIAKKYRFFSFGDGMYIRS